MKTCEEKLELIKKAISMILSSDEEIEPELLVQGLIAIILGIIEDKVTATEYPEDA